MIPCRWPEINNRGLIVKEDLYNKAVLHFSNCEIQITTAMVLILEKPNILKGIYMWTPGLNT